MLATQEFTVKVDNKTILKDLNLSFEPGIHIVMGPNGVGKSTLAQALMGNPNYSSTGAIKLNDTIISELSVSERAQAGLFLSFQTPTPIEGLSNFQFIKHILANGEKSPDITVITKMLSEFKKYSEQFKLSSDWHKKQLNVEASGGEKKKNEIIQMMMLDPAVAILDEPDSGLDIDAINTLADMIKEFASRENKTVIVITHYEKLINKLSPTSTTVITPTGVIKQAGSALANEILAEGFGKYE